MKYRASPLEFRARDRAHLTKCLQRFRAKRILVIGDVGVDRYTIGRVERISQEAPVPIVLVESEKLKLGLAANVSDNIYALGGVSLLVGLTGKDPGAADLKRMLRKIKVETSHLISERSRQTIIKDRIVTERQQLLRVDYEDASLRPNPKTEAKILEQVDALIESVDAIVLQDYAKGLFTAELGAHVFALASRYGKCVAVDPNSKTNVQAYRGASVLTPNKEEAESLAGLKIKDESTLFEAGGRILKSTEAQHVVITRGKEGMAVFSLGSSNCRIIPTFARDVYDVSGAGDTVISVLSLALASGSAIEDAALLANLAAGIEVGKRGTATVSVKEIREAMKQAG